MYNRNVVSDVPAPFPGTGRAKPATHEGHKAIAGERGAGAATGLDMAGRQQSAPAGWSCSPATRRRRNGRIGSTGTCSREAAGGAPLLATPDLDA